jgi:hypothetical protein
MITKQTINQNPERYSKEGNNWKISASKDIKPLYLPIGIPLSNLKPLISADGIIVKVGEDYLCSLITLNNIKDSNNPHYDIVENGKLKIKDKEVIIGKTIRIIELDISRLQTIGDLQDTKGIRAGVSSVEYIYEGNKTDGVSNNLITQINYTLNKDSIRGLDTYTLYQLEFAPDATYSLGALDIAKQPENELLDMSKLKVFTEGVRERLVLLRKDFNMIKKMFFEGLINVNSGRVEITTEGLADPLSQLQGIKDYHQVIYKEVGDIQTIRDIQAPLRSVLKTIEEQSKQIESTQTTQQQLNQQLAQTKEQLIETQKKLASR